MSGPHISLDPDPLAPDDRDLAYAAGWVAGWDAADESHGSGLAAIVTGIVLGALVAGVIFLGWATVTHAAPRSAAEPVIPAATSARLRGTEGSDLASGNLAPRPTGAPLPGGTSTPATDGNAPKGTPSPATTEPTAIEGGTASWCAPTPTHCQSWGPPALLGAVPSFRYGDRPYRARVCRADDASRCAVVLVVSFCACPTRVIDLSPAAFARLAPLSRGLVRVTIADAGRGPDVTPPPTDTSP